MKTRNKVVLLALCMAAIIVVSVLGTMAYLTSTKTITNTFTVGNVTITLDETVVDLYGNATGDGRSSAGNTYKLMPGHTYMKDPVIHVAAGSEGCYLFIKVENDLATYEAASEENGYKTIADQLYAAGWRNVSGNVYVYTDGDATNPQKTIVGQGTDITVFTNFKIKNDADLRNITPYDPQNPDADYDKIEITAYAVQADGFENKEPAEIWTAASFN